MESTRLTTRRAAILVAACLVVVLSTVALGAPDGPRRAPVLPAPAPVIDVHSSADLPVLAGELAAGRSGVDAALVFGESAWSDGLAAAAAAAHRGAGLLIVRRDDIPPATALALGRLAPRQIVVIGGEDAVSIETYRRLGALTGVPVSRVSGADRYATAGALAATTFGRPAAVVLIDGSRAVDIAAATPVAAALGAPVLLADRGSLPSPTISALDALRPTRVVIVGGVAAVSEQAEDHLRGLGATITRLAGIDRVETAAAATYLLPPSNGAALTSGSSPTATVLLAAAAARMSAPVLLVPDGCVPRATEQILAERGVSRLLALDAPPGMWPSCGSSVTTTTVPPTTTTTRPTTTTTTPGRPARCQTNPPPRPAIDTGYRFLAEKDGRPVRWDPCRPIKVFVNPRNAAPGSTEVLERVLDELAAASGLRFVLAGPTNRAPETSGSFTCQPTNIEPQILVGFVPPGGLGPDIAGTGGSCYATWYYDGEVTVTNDITVSYEEIGLGHLLLHEFGHALGLHHVQDPTSVMCSGCWAAVHLGPGDLAGLWRLGPGAGTDP